MDLKNVCAQKKTFQQKAAEIQALCFVVNLFLIQPIEGNDCRFSGWTKVPDAFVWVQHG